MRQFSSLGRSRNKVEWQVSSYFRKSVLKKWMNTFAVVNKRPFNRNGRPCRMEWLSSEEFERDNAWEAIRRREWRQHQPHWYNHSERPKSPRTIVILLWALPSLPISWRGHGTSTSRDTYKHDFTWHAINKKLWNCKLKTCRYPVLRNGQNKAIILLYLYAYRYGHSPWRQDS